jgi:hypothetical protein
MALSFANLGSLRLRLKDPGQFVAGEELSIKDDTTDEKFIYKKKK